MALHPPDRHVQTMFANHGTKHLITDYASERIYAGKQASFRETKWCGGKNGFDDFVEQWQP